MPYVAAIVPASYLSSKLFFDRLSSFVFLNDKDMFSDTENPVGLALFSSKSQKIDIYQDDTRIGEYHELLQYVPDPKPVLKLKFNSTEGELGLVGIDDTYGPSIHFCRGEELKHYSICHSSRSITRISGLEVSALLLRALNEQLACFREATQDIFLTPFKGLRKDGKYRRRIDYRLARKLIQYTHAILG